MDDELVMSLSIRTLRTCMTGFDWGIDDDDDALTVGMI